MKKYELNGFSIREYEELGSTNTLAEELPEPELKDKEVVLTFRQTQGKGQVGNKWESAPDKNISMTLVFKPSRLEASCQFAVSMVIALGCCDYVAQYTGESTVKWPNDIYVGDRKIAGILISHSVRGAFVGTSLCGIGVNINQECFVSDAPNPVSLYQLTGKVIALQDALAGLLDCIGRRYGQIHDYEMLERDFMRVLYRREGVYDWEDARGRFRASVKGLDEYGQLVLEDACGCERVYAFKEVKYL